MTLFLKDLLHDLREKHLWPVAALLLLAIVAFPAVLLRSPSDEGTAAVPATPSAAGANADAAIVALAGEGDVAPSRLGSFRAKDPFKPRGPAAPAPLTSPTPSRGPGPTLGTPPSSLFGGGSSPGFGGSSPGFGGSSPGFGGSSPGYGTQPTQPAPVLYTYTVDVRFGPRGDESTHSGVTRMEPLPDSENPLLLFLGTSASGRSAVFLVDQSLEQRGEGTCKPDRTNCSLLYLRDDPDHDLHFFTDVEGRRYALRLVEIELVPVEEALSEDEDETLSEEEEEETPDEEEQQEAGEEEETGEAGPSRTKRDDERARWPFDVGPFADLVR